MIAKCGKCGSVYLATPGLPSSEMAATCRRCGAPLGPDAEALSPSRPTQPIVISTSSRSDCDGSTDSDRKEDQEYYYALDGRPAGPVPFATLRGLVSTGIVKGSTLIWKYGWGEWKTLASAPEFHESANQRPLNVSGAWESRPATPLSRAAEAPEPRVPAPPAALGSCPEPHAVRIEDSQHTAAFQAPISDSEPRVFRRRPNSKTPGPQCV